MRNIDFLLFDKIKNDTTFSCTGNLNQLVSCFCRCINPYPSTSTSNIYELISSFHNCISYYLLMENFYEIGKCKNIWLMILS